MLYELRDPNGQPAFYMPKDLKYVPPLDVPGSLRSGAIVCSITSICEFFMHSQILFRLFHLILLAYYEL